MVVVEVTAADIPTPLVFNIAVTSGMAFGAISIPTGSNRLIALRAYDAGGIETHSGSATLNVQPGTNPALAIVLTSLSGSVPITATLGGSHITVQPSVDSVSAGDTLTLTATILGDTGVVTGQVAWATANPALATVVSTGPQTGLVTGRSPGVVNVVATFGGFSGSAAIVVTPRFAHVFVVVEENTNYADVIGNPAMPYLDGLASQYGVATQYYGNSHPSIGNYFMLTVGDTITSDDNYSTIVTKDNIVRELVVAGKSWRSYAGDLPFVGYTGPDTGLYTRRHNPFALISDVVNDTTQVKNLVPFSYLAQDLAGNSLPNYAFIVPNLCDDAHDCPLSSADTWLQTNIDPLIKSAQFQKDGLLIIVFDEAATDLTHGGGRVAWVVVTPKAKRGYQSTTLYQHQSTLRLTAEVLGLSVLPNHAATAPSMDEFFAR